MTGWLVVGSRQEDRLVADSVLVVTGPDASPEEVDGDRLVGEIVSRTERMLVVQPPDGAEPVTVEIAEGADDRGSRPFRGPTASTNYATGSTSSACRSPAATW